MKFSGFMNGCAGKVISFILSVLLGVVLTLGGIVGGGYILLTKKGMLLKAEEYAQQQGLAIDFEDTVAQGTILDWGKQLAAILKDTGNSTIGSIESMAGVSAISAMLNQMLGIDQDIIKQATISNIGETISSNLTMSIAQEKFGITFPDMPLFEDEDFLAKPIGEAFGDFDDYTLAQVMNIDESSHAALRALSDVAIKDLGGAVATEAINGLCLCELMTIDENSSQTLQALKYCTIDSTYTYAEGSTEKLVDTNGRYIYATKELTITNDDASVSVITVEMQGISDKMKELKVSDVITITETSNAILRKMRTATQAEIDAGKESLFGTENLLIDELGGSKFNDIIDNTEIGEIITVYEEDVYEGATLVHAKSEPIMIAMNHTKIMDLNTKMQTLQLDEIFEATSLTTGPLSLIDSDTTLPEIPDAMTDVMQNSTIITLKEKGVISEDNFADVDEMPIEQRSFIYNNTMGNLLGGMISFIAHPIDYSDPLNPVPNYGVVQHPDVNLVDTVTSYATLSDFVSTYTQYSIVSDDVATVTITVGGEGTADYTNYYNAAEACYYIPLFNLETATDYVFIFEGGATALVKLAVYDGTVLSAHQYGYYYAYTDNQIPAINTITFQTIS